MPRLVDATRRRGPVPRCWPTAPWDSTRVARSPRGEPPGLLRGPWGRPTPPAPPVRAATATTASRTRRTEPATATRASGRNMAPADCRKPATTARATRARGPVPRMGPGPPGQDDQQRGDDQVERVGGDDRAAEPGERARWRPGCRRTGPPSGRPRSRPATTVSPAASGRRQGATTRTSDRTVPRPVACTRRPDLDVEPVARAAGADRG